MKRLVMRTAIAGLCALSPSACIDSARPILTDSQPLLGERVKVQLYTLRDGHATDPERARFAWDGKRYARAGGGMKDIASFSLHPFEDGDSIVQSVSARHLEHVEYAIAHPLADGVYLVNAVDEEDADATARAQCQHPGNAGCRIETREQLLTFARATAAKKKAVGGLAIRLEDDKHR